MTAPGPTAGAAFAVTALARTAGGLRVRLAVAGAPDVTVVITPRDGKPAWAETRHLSVRYEGSALAQAQEAALRIVAASLRGVTFEEIARRVPMSPGARSPGPEGTDSPGGEDRSDQVLTVDEWGNPDRWRTFIFRREFMRNASSSIRFTGWNVVEVSHGESECRFATPCIDGRTMSLYNYPWVRSLERAVGPAGRACDGPPRLPSFICTDLRDADIITGGTARLDAVLGALAPLTAPGDLVLVKSTCVPRVIGDDMEGAVARWRGRGRIRYGDVFAPEPTDFVSEILIEAIASGKRRRRRGPAVNIAGLAEGEALVELRGFLEGAGIAVNCVMIPDIDLDAATFWRAAPVQVLVPNPYYRKLYEKVLAPLRTKTLSPPPPYGIAATEAWVGEIARACGRGAAFRKVWRAANARLAPAFAVLRGEAAGARLGFVIAPEDYAALCEPMETAGIPVLDVAVELGFGIDLLVFAGGGGSTEPAIRPGHERAVAIHRFADRASLDALLRDAPCAAVYSDLYGDERITAAGKAPFSLQFFEPGLAGALRTGERLLGACRLPFYGKYGRHGRAN
ncbi:MAG: nitrogenase component 1 [Myxococcota bacterium]|nr:nitrogenase component 1 [Myxococcota bacterium]